jgi:hypothetical protein
VYEQIAGKGGPRRLYGDAISLAAPIAHVVVESPAGGERT